jgi:ribosomal protein L12E/L44/L45/RPP1/RPP2
MTYEDLKAAELRALCEQRGIKPSRAKADMIADLKAKDAADALIKHDEDAGLYAHETASEEVQAPEVPAEPEKPAETPSEPEDEDAWVENGRLYKRYRRQSPVLGDREHADNLADIAGEAVRRGREPYGLAFRVRDTDIATWLYAINVR